MGVPPVITKYGRDGRTTRASHLHGRDGCTTRTTRGAFSLIEILISIVVLVIALAVVTQVVALTTQTAAATQAIAEIETRLRAFEVTLRRDLEGVNPARSVLMIHGRTQAAALDDDRREGEQYYRFLVGDPQVTNGGDSPEFDPLSALPDGKYSDPRADILMFFTERPLASQAPAEEDLGGVGQAKRLIHRKAQVGATFTPSQIVYGHAALADAFVNDNGDIELTSPRHITDAGGNRDEISDVPVQEWHLARRAVLLSRALLSGGEIGRPQSVQFIFDSRGEPAMPQITRFFADADLGGGQRQSSADVMPFDYESFLQIFQPFAYNLTSPFAIDGMARLSPYESQEWPYPPVGGGNALATPLSFGAINPASSIGPLTRSNLLEDDLLYDTDDAPLNNRFVALVVPQPPIELESNLGLHMLPGCAWFKVEFLLPEDPRNAKDHPLQYQRNDALRWVEAPNGESYVFVPDSPENREFLATSTLLVNGDVPLTNTRTASFAQVVPPNLSGALPFAGNTVDNRRIRLWPWAIRITVKVFDPRGRLDSPIERVIVHRFD